MRSPGLHAPRSDTDWTGLTAMPIPVGEAVEWAVTPGCGAVVSFAGTVRDHAEGRPGVTLLEYEAYDGEVEPRLLALASEARRLWPGLGRLVLLHRTGALKVEETAVLVVAGAPHREEAFEAARWCIDTLKARIPIWKRETWQDGVDWGTGASGIADQPPVTGHSDPEVSDS